MELVGFAAQESKGVGEVIELRGPYGFGRVAVIDRRDGVARVNEEIPLPEAITLVAETKRPAVNLDDQRRPGRGLRNGEIKRIAGRAFRVAQVVQGDQ